MSVQDMYETAARIPTSSVFEHRYRIAHGVVRPEWHESFSDFENIGING